jgi:predicted transcriptional regulator
VTVKQTQGRRPKAAEEEFTDAIYRRTPAGTNEIAQLVGLSRQATEYRLKKIEQDGPIWSKKVGPTRVWIHGNVISEP